MYWVYLQQNESYLAYCNENKIPEAECNLLEKLWRDLLSINIYYTILIFIAFFLSNYFRSLRWRMMLKSIGYEVRGINSLASILVGYLANLGLPRSGEFIRPALLSRYEKVPITVSVGTVALDRLVDLLSMSLIMLFTILSQMDTFVRLYDEHLSGVPLIQQLILPVCGFIFLTLCFLTRKIWRDWPIVVKFKNKIRGFLDGLLSIRKVENKASFLFYTLMIWVWFFVMMYAALQSFSATANLSLSAALVIYVFGSLGMLVPTPGGVGSYHFLVILALGYFGIAQGDAFSFANISFFSAQFANNIVLGISAIIIMYFYNKKHPVQRIQ